MKKQYLLVSILLFLVSFIGYFNNLIIGPLLNNMAFDLKVSVSNLGFLVTLYGLVAGFISLIIGPFSDKFGRKKTIVLFAALTAGTSLLFSFSWDLKTLFIFRFLNAMTAGPLIFCAIASVGDYIPAEKRGTVTGIVTSSMFIGTIVGVPMALLLLKHPVLNWRASFYLISFIAILTSLLVAFLLPRNKAAKTNSVISLKGILKNYFSFFKDKKYLGFVTIFLLVSFSIGIFITYFPTYLLNNRKLSLDNLILIYAIGGIFALFFNLIAGRLSDKKNRKLLVITGSLIIAGMMVAIIHVATTPSTLFITVLIISIFYMSAEAFRLTPLQTEALIIVPLEFRGFFIGTIAFLIAGGTSLGAAFGSFLLSIKKGEYIKNLTLHGKNLPEKIHSLLFGFKTVTYISIVAVFLSIILILLYVKKRKQGQTI